MAVSGIFTLEDLYGGRSPDYYHSRIRFLSELNEPPSIVHASHAAELITSTEIHSLKKANKLADVIPFTYFYWVLLVLAILLTLILIIFFIGYCRSFVRNYRARRESLASYNRYAPAKRHVYSKDIYPRETAVTSEPARILPTPPCPSISLRFIDDQLYRHDSSDTTNSPPSVRHDIFLKEPLSTFMSSSSNLHSQLSARSSEPPLKVDQSYESQRASMVLPTDEHETNSLIIDIN